MGVPVRSVVDAGFLVALLDGDDDWHEWAVAAAPLARGPWVTCEACISEALVCLRGRARPARGTLFAWQERGLLVVRSFLPEHRARLEAELGRYHARDMDFADACVVLLSDEFPRLPVFTTNRRDFLVYFRGRSPRALHAPTA